MNSYSPSQRCCTINNNQTASNQFEDNYHGILTHSGEVKVAKGDVEQEILYIDDDGIVLVDAGRKAYQALIHSKLLGLIQYATEGDIALIKFIKGEAFIVGFRKINQENKYEKDNL